MKKSGRKIEVLIFGAGGRQALPVCKGFFDIGCNVTAYCERKLDTGYLSKYPTKKIVYDKNNEEKAGFFEYGEAIISSGEYDLVVPLGDEGAKYLAKNKKRLECFAKIAVNDYETFQFAIDKAKTMKVCMQNGIPVPHTITSDNPLEDIPKSNIKYPLVVKPVTGLGSVGFNIIKDEHTLKKFIDAYDNRFGRLLFQEYISQGEEPQYRADLFRDRNGKYKAALVGKVTRWYPLDGGSGIFAVTINNEEILDNCKKLLDTINWNGYANIDLVWDVNSGEAKIIEINGRTGATIMQDYDAGVNISQLILENELGMEVTDMTEYTVGKKISCFLPDVLWLLKSPNRFNTDPSWFDRRGVKDTIFSLEDPLPFLGFLITSIASFRDSMRKRKRIG